MRGKPQEEFIGTDGLAEITHAPLGTVYRWIADGKAPVHYRVGKRVLFRVEDVHAWLEERKVDDVRG